MRKDAFERENSETQAQLEIVHCPEGTIPILRTKKSISQLKPNATTNLFSPGIQVKHKLLNHINYIYKRLGCIFIYIKKKKDWDVLEYKSKFGRGVRVLLI